MSARQRARAMVLVVGVLLLPACTSPPSAADHQSQTPTAHESSSPTTAPPTPSPTKTTPAGISPADLSFEAGTVLAEGNWQMGWVEVLGAAPGFSVAGADDGNGHFAYNDDGTGCKLTFYQGSITDIDMTQDDRTISDDFLTVMLNGTSQGGVTREDVAAHAYDDVAGQYPGPGTVATRTIWGTGSEGETWLHSTRMFGALGGGVYVGILCPPGQDAQVELNTLASQYAAIQIEARDG